MKRSLGVQQIKHQHSQFQGDKDTVTINWGFGDPLPRECYKGRVINDFPSVALAINKLRFLRCCVGNCRHVPFTERELEADEWVRRGHTVYCRTRLEGYEGQGITVARTARELVPARLYTKGINAEKEYRVHVVGEQAIAVHRKVSEKGDADPSIRNTANGWVFKKVTIYDKDIVEQAVKSVRAAGLDFAAVDILFDGRSAWVLEANTAPGIDGMEWTVEQYAKALRALAERIPNKI